MSDVIYLDNAATTFPKPENVYNAMDEANRNYCVNAGRSSYKLAKKATEIIEDTKKLLLKLVNAKNSANVVFSPSVTISLNQILNGLDFVNNSTVYVSPYEHNAVARPLNLISKKNSINIRELPLNENTLEIDIERMKYMFAKEHPACVCSTFVSNVTGYILPIDEIFREAKKYNAVTVLDAAQAIGLIDINLEKLDIDFLAFAGHKTLYGPFGIAGFIDNSSIYLKEFIVGGTGSDSLNLDMPKNSPNKYEYASPNIVAIAGLKAALDYIDVDKIHSHERLLTDYLIKGLEDIKGIKIYLPHNLINHISIVSFVVDGYKSEDIGMILDEDFNIAVRTGYHCAPFIHKYLKDEFSLGTVRVGLSYFNSKEDVRNLINAINDILLI
ncbi:cysteine desulfurase family protein [Sedimentibacter acidaminivorans]|uniref:Cysteine desulfurase family protein n=1 Tax=Sedimentibacter acidaminivorans TaxID=913099 RepID=A0ABS4GC66_9FIRM|nr:cysteine desulfurase family protein [Sedimentibacter acidaminivorans]